MFNRLHQYNETLERLANQLPNLSRWEEDHGEHCIHRDNWPVVMALFPEIKPLFLLAMTEDWRVVQVQNFEADYTDQMRTPDHFLLRRLTDGTGTGLNYILADMVQKLETAIMIASEEEWGPGIYNPANLNRNGRVDHHSHFTIKIIVAEETGVITGTVYADNYILDIAEDEVHLICARPY